MRLKKLLIIPLTLSAALIPIAITSHGQDANSHAVAKGLQNAFSDVAEKAFPCVVIIKVKKASAQEQPLRGHRILPPWLQAPEQPQDEVVGMGSGFIIREDGYIVTNHHVAGNATEMSVTLHDGREMPAKRIGTDWKTDISILKIDVKDKLPTLKFADSDKVKVGYWAIAIGAPYSLGYTMTTGIVSQKGRSVGLNLYEDYIQTDAAINPGNSGGPLLNIDGEVIGVNDFIVGSGSGQQGEIVGTTGLAFAIPSNIVSSVSESIMKNGEVVRPWIGISMQEMDASVKQQLKVESGVLVKGVVSGDPADKAGLEPGDVIIKVGGIAVKSSKEVQFAILKYQPGEKIPFTIVREGVEKTLNVVAGRQRSDSVAGTNDNERSSMKGVSKASSETFESFGLRLADRGGQVYVEAVGRGSVADEAGLQSGMLIYAVNRRKVSSVAEADKAAASSAKKLLLYIDDGSSRYFIALSK